MTTPEEPAPPANPAPAPQVVPRQAAGNRGARGRGRGRGWANQRRGRYRANGYTNNPKYRGPSGSSANNRAAESPLGPNNPNATNSAPLSVADHQPYSHASASAPGSMLKEGVQASYGIVLPKGIVTFIGAGNMARALITGLLACGMDSSKIRATARTAGTLAYLENKLPQASLFTANVSASTDADIVVICVKPHIVETVCRELASKLKPGTIVISVAAGVAIAQIEAWLQEAKAPIIVRAMPNVASSVGKGATALCVLQGTPPQDAVSLFSCSGTTIAVEERLLPAVAGISGCGISYSMIFAEALADAGVKHGLPRDVARSLSSATLLGAGTIALANPDTHFAQIRNSIESPGGVTIAAVAALERAGFRAAAHDAVDKAVERMAELAGNEKDANDK